MAGRRLGVQPAAVLVARVPVAPLAAFPRDVERRLDQRVGLVENAPRYFLGPIEGLGALADLADFPGGEEDAGMGPVGELDGDRLGGLLRGSREQGQCEKERHGDSALLGSSDVKKQISKAKHAF